MKNLLILFGIATLFFSCSPSGSNSKEQATGYNSYNGETQGTYFQIQYKDTADFRPNVNLILKQIDDVFNLWDSTSVISRLNAWDKPGELFKFQDSTLNFSSMMDASKDIYKKTEHAFDPSVLPLLRLWNFGKDIAIEPTQAELDSVQEIIGFEDFDFTLYDNAYEDQTGKPTMIRKTHKDRNLDFNAIVQGYTCDLIGDMFLENGVENFMVNVGGEVVVHGVNPSNAPWTLGIQDPRKADGEYKSVIRLKDRAVATSGSYNKYKMINGVRHSHTIDGRIGRPVTHSLLSCTVVAASAYEADAYATAFMVMGTDEVNDFLFANPELGLEVYLIEDIAGELHVTYTPNFPILE